MPSLTVENYLKAILQISLRTGADCVTTGQLSQEVGVSPGTVTSMLKTLATAAEGEEPLATYRPYEGVRLTETGHRTAIRMLRRHRLIELFLVQTLGLSWDQVHEEAEHMEHAVSDVLIDRIDDFLGHPATDPHGDPIPSADGIMRGRPLATSTLADCEPGTTLKVVRVTNQDSEFLRFLSEHGIEIGAVVGVRQNNRHAGIVTLSIGADDVTLGRSAAAEIIVEPATTSRHEVPDE